MEIFDLLADPGEATIRICGREKMPWWKLGSLCRYDSNAYGEGYEFIVNVALNHYEIKRKTPKGCWIDIYGTEKFVLDNARKRWAYPTEELARESFIARKQSQIQHLKRQLEHAEAALAHMSKETGEQS